MTREEIIKIIGEAVLNALQDATNGKHKGANSVVVPIDCHHLFKDGNPWISSVEMTIPSFIYVTGPLDDREFHNMSLDEYMGWIDKNGN